MATYVLRDRGPAFPINSTPRYEVVVWPKYRPITGTGDIVRIYVSESEARAALALFNNPLLATPPRYQFIGWQEMFFHSRRREWLPTGTVSSARRKPRDTARRRWVRWVV